MRGIETAREGEVISVYLQDVLELVAEEDVLVVVVDLRVVGDEGVLRADVDGVVDLPVDVPHLPGRVEQTLQRRASSDKSQSDPRLISPALKPTPVLTCRQYCSMRQGPRATLSPSRAPMTAWMT